MFSDKHSLDKYLVDMLFKGKHHSVILFFIECVPYLKALKLIKPMRLAAAQPSLVWCAQ